MLIDYIFNYSQNLIMKILRSILVFALTSLAVLSIYSAISSKGPTQDFSFQNSPTCDFQVSVDKIIAGASNVAHLKGFFIMSLLALFTFKRRKFLGASVYVVALTLVTELMQMWSLSRHCRLIDSIPNFLGLICAMVTFWLASKVIIYYQNGNNVQA